MESIDSLENRNYMEKMGSVEYLEFIDETASIMGVSCGYIGSIMGVDSGECGGSCWLLVVRCSLLVVCYEEFKMKELGGQEVGSWRLEVVGC